MQWYGMQCMTSLLPSNPTKGSEGCNHVAQFNVRCCTGTYRTNIRLWCLLMHTKGRCTNATLQCMDFIYFKLQYKRNTTMDDKVYSKISKINFIYQVIWLMWILKLSGGNSNNKWKRVDHDATFTCLLQLSRHKIKHGPKEHHLTISNSQHQQPYTWNNQQVQWSYAPTRRPAK
jgi:hypothetical protein